MMDKLHLFLRTARKSRSERNCSGFFLYPGIIKRCTPLGSKCTPHRPFGKWYRRIKRKKLYGDHFGTTVEPVFVKRYGKTLVNRGFCKKKLDTRFDTHCIKTGVQLWLRRQDSNLRPPGYEAVSSTNRSRFGSDLCFLPPFARRIFRCFRPALPAFFGFWVKTGSSAVQPNTVDLQSGIDLY